MEGVMTFNKFITIILIATIFTPVHLFATDDLRPEIRIPTDPVISLNFGMSDLSLKDFDHTFGNLGMLELKLGFASLDPKRGDTKILDLMQRYLSIAHISTNIGNGAETGELESSVWRIGLVSENGYGYTLSSTSSTPSIILMHSRGVAWSDVDIDQPLNPPQDGFRPSRFEDAVRFGSMTEAGVMVQLSNVLSVNASFERSIVYERHLFWKWIGSVVIEGGAHSLIDRFVDAVFDSTPSAGPVVNFLLKNGLSYALYELRRSDMNWPFDTAAPLHHDTFKVGVSFIF